MTETHKLLDKVKKKVINFCVIGAAFKLIPNVTGLESMSSQIFSNVNFEWIVQTADDLA